jgi:hypothetical protein
MHEQYNPLLFKCLFRYFISPCTILCCISIFYMNIDLVSVHIFRLIFHIFFGSFFCGHKGAPNKHMGAQDTCRSRRGTSLTRIVLEVFFLSGCWSFFVYMLKFSSV